MNENNHHDALIHIMVTMSAADRSMTDSELEKMGTIIRTLPVFEDFDEERLVQSATTCSMVLQEEDGLKQILQNAKAKIPPHLYETAYALAVEIAAADLHLEQEELRLLQILRDTFDLDRLACAAIERGARARHYRV